MNWNKWVRQTHRWVSIAFTVTVIANFIALAQGGGMPPPWVTYSPLLPLALLLFTGCTCSCCRMPRSGAAGGAPASQRRCARSSAGQAKRYVMT